MIAEAGFTHVRIGVQAASRALIDGWRPGDDASKLVASALIEAVKPGHAAVGAAAAVG